MHYEPSKKNFSLIKNIPNRSCEFTTRSLYRCLPASLNYSPFHLLSSYPRPIKHSTLSKQDKKDTPNKSTPLPIIALQLHCHYQQQSQDIFEPFHSHTPHSASHKSYARTRARGPKNKKPLSLSLSLSSLITFHHRRLPISLFLSLPSFAQPRGIDRRSSRVYAACCCCCCTPPMYTAPKW